jgi:hypothetical protein
VHRQDDLVQIVLAAHSSSCGTCGLDCWQKQPNQNANDRDHDQEFNESEPTSLYFLLHSASQFHGTHGRQSQAVQHEQRLTTVRSVAGWETIERLWLAGLEWLLQMRTILRKEYQQGVEMQEQE